MLACPNGRFLDVCYMDTDLRKRRLSMRELLIAVTYAAVAMGLVRIGIDRSAPIAWATGSALLFVGLYCAAGFFFAGRKGGGLAVIVGVLVVILTVLSLLLS